MDLFREIKVGMDDMFADVVGVYGKLRGKRIEKYVVQEAKQSQRGSLTLYMGAINNCKTCKKY